MKIALVHDDLIQHGGAERLFEAMVEIWPEADVFTSMTTWDRNPSGLDDDWSTRRVGKNSKLKTSFMQQLPLKEKLYRHYFLLYPLAFESFDFTGYDVVLSSSSRFSHGVVTRPETLHICYMNSPGHMLWEPHAYFRASARKEGAKRPHFDSSPLHIFTSPIVSYLRLWDYAAAQRVDYFVANSKTPQKRIKKYYGRDSQIIYPFVDLERFDKNAAAFPNPSGLGDSTRRVSPAAGFLSDYFLVVSRLAAWKKIDIAVEACNKLKIPLKIIGEGPDRNRLEKLAGPTVELLGRLTDEEVVSYYQGCRALVFPQKEDFGITPLEAQAAGKPVIAFRAGGALETVIGGKTGEFFSPQTVEALAAVLKKFDLKRYQKEDCYRQAEKFSKRRFQGELKNFVTECYEKHA